MALLKLSGIATAISGKLGGSIFATTGNGSVMKQNSYSQQHATPLQSAQRTQVYQVSQQWRSIGLSNQALWEAEAINYPYTNRVGDTVYYTGYQLFLNCNQGRLLCNLSPLVAPATFETPTIPVITLYKPTPTEFFMSYTGNDVNNRWSYFSAPPFLSGKKIQYSDLKFWLNVVANNVSGTISVSDDWPAYFPYPTTGQVIAIYIKAINKNTGFIAGRTNLTELVY